MNVKSNDWDSIREALIFWANKVSPGSAKKWYTSREAILALANTDWTKQGGTSSSYSGVESDLFNIVFTDESESEIAYIKSKYVLTSDTIKAYETLFIPDGTDDTQHTISLTTNIISGETPTGIGFGGGSLSSLEDVYIDSEALSLYDGLYFDSTDSLWKTGKVFVTTLGNIQQDISGDKRFELVHVNGELYIPDGLDLSIHKIHLTTDIIEGETPTGQLSQDLISVILEDYITSSDLSLALSNLSGNINTSLNGYATIDSLLSYRLISNGDFTDVLISGTNAIFSNTVTAQTITLKYDATHSAQLCIDENGNIYIDGNFYATGSVASGGLGQSEYIPIEFEDYVLHTELTTILIGYSQTGHNHDSLYYSKTWIDNYFAEKEHSHAAYISSVVLSGSTYIPESNVLTLTQANINSIVGTIGVAQGGTGRTSLDSGKVLIGAGTNAVAYRTIVHNTDGTLSYGEDLITASTLYYYTGSSNREWNASILVLPSTTGKIYWGNTIFINTGTGSFYIGANNSSTYLRGTSIYTTNLIPTRTNSFDLGTDILKYKTAYINTSIKLGNIIIYYDSVNNAIKVDGDIYATGSMSAGGFGGS